MEKGENSITITATSDSPELVKNIHEYGSVVAARGKSAKAG